MATERKYRRNDVSRQLMTNDIVTELRLSVVTSHVAIQTNVKIRKSPKIPKRVRLARSHIAHAVR